MSRDAARRLLATWCSVTAIGIVTYWVTWFSTDHAASWLPVGYVEHERVFVFPDSILAALLVATATLLLLDRPAARLLAAFCAGMMMFLAVIDAAYFAQHGLFDPARDGVLNAFLIVALFGLITGLTLHVRADGRRPLRRLGP